MALLVIAALAVVGARALKGVRGRLARELRGPVASALPSNELGTPAGKIVIKRQPMPKGTTQEVTYKLRMHSVGTETSSSARFTATLLEAEAKAVRVAFHEAKLASTGLAAYVEAKLADAGTSVPLPTIDSPYVIRGMTVEDAKGTTLSLMDSTHILMFSTLPASDLLDHIPERPIGAGDEIAELLPYAVTGDDDIPVDKKSAKLIEVREGRATFELFSHGAASSDATAVTMSFTQTTTVTVRIADGWLLRYASNGAATVNATKLDAGTMSTESEHQVDVAYP